MIIRSLFAPLVFLLISQYAHAAIIVDVNDFTRIDRGGGVFQDFLIIPGTGITQLTPAGTYSVDIEFEPGQSFGVEPISLIGGNSFIQLSFGNVIAATGDDPELVLSFGTLEFTGLSGDFDPLSPILNLSLASFGQNEMGIDFVNIDLVDALTTTGFSFTDLHYDFTLANQGSAHPVDVVVLSVFAFQPVPVPGTISLLVLGLAGMGLSKRKCV